MEHGLPNNIYSWVWGLGVPASYLFLAHFFKKTDAFPGVARRGGTLNDIMAFEIIAGLCVCYLASTGCYIWFDIGNNGIYNELLKDPIYGFSDVVQNHLAIPMIFFQGWNVVLCLLAADLRDVTMIVHHVLVTLLAYMGLHPYVHIDAMFFFGVAELTNIPLTIIDVFKYLPDLKKNYPAANEACRSIFAVLFIVLRLLVWPVYCYPFWVHSLQLLTIDQSSSINRSIVSFFTKTLSVPPLDSSVACHSTFVVCFFLFANVMLTLLQFYWGFTIFGFLFVKKSSKKE